MAQNFQYNPSAFEYTPEINANYLSILQRPIRQQGQMDVGAARGEALRRGLTGDPFESLRVGAAKNTMNTNLTDTSNNLAYQGAGLQRQERMGVEQFGRESQYQSTEAQKSRDFQQQMAQIQQEYQKQLLKYQQKLSHQDTWSNFGGDLLGFGLGAATGGLGGVLGKKLGDYLTTPSTKK